MLDEHMNQKQNHILILINGPIVKNVVGYLFFYPENYKDVTCGRSLQQFRNLNALEPENLEECKGHVYKIVIRTPQRFNLCFYFLVCRACFRVCLLCMNCIQIDSGFILYGDYETFSAFTYTWLCALASFIYYPTYWYRCTLPLSHRMVWFTNEYFICRCACTYTWKANCSIFIW